MIALSGSSAGKRECVDKSNDTEESDDTEESFELTDDQLEEVIGGQHGRRLQRYIASIMNQHSGSLRAYERDMYNPSW